jgi:ABC-type multidrug transport system ATPase subunit
VTGASAAGASAAGASAAVRLEGVRVAYAPGRPGAPAADALACDALGVGAGLTLVVGPNGAGKSTLLRVAAGVERPGRGRVWLLGHDAWRDEVAARRALAYVPEHPELTPYATVGEVLRLVARLRGCAESAAAEALAAAGLGALGDRTVRELSMGQRRRALLAAAWVGAPRLVVLDEPLEAMDRPTRAAVVRWAAERRAAGAAVLVATHEVAPFAPLVDDVLVVRAGRVARAPALPADPAARLARLEALAGGDLPSGEADAGTG